MDESLYKVIRTWANVNNENFVTKRKLLIEKYKKSATIIIDIKIRTFNAPVLLNIPFKVLKSGEII